MKQIIIKNEDETKAFGEKLASRLKKGDILALVGDLGTGKTALTKYIAKGLGIKSEITSPTFTIVREYKEGRLPLYHFDVYRTGSVEEMYDLGYEEYFYGDGVCVIEWADMISEIIPEEALIIAIDSGSTPDERVYRCNFDIDSLNG